MLVAHNSRDASPIWCVTFSKFLRHQLNGMNKLSHTHTLPLNWLKQLRGPAASQHAQRRTTNASPTEQRRTLPLECLLRPFVPIVKSAHFLTIAGNYWPRRLDLKHFPVNEKLYQTEPDVQGLVHSQRPAADPRAQLILIHGLEGSSDAGYARSLAQAALDAGYAVHRFTMRSCGGTGHLSGKTLYHARHTRHVLAVARELRQRDNMPIYLVGFSLGGNVVLKLAGELGERVNGVIDGVCGVSTPIDLAACVRRLHQRSNFLYAHRFLKHLN